MFRSVKKFVKQSKRKSLPKGRWSKLEVILLKPRLLMFTESIILEAKIINALRSTARSSGAICSLRVSGNSFRNPSNLLARKVHRVHTHGRNRRLSRNF